jgi:hypothetical protein
MVEELEKRLFRMCGVNPRFGMDLRGYRREVVTPLWKIGMVPGKTQVGEHRGIVILLKSPLMVPRKLKMTDMDGAYYTEFFVSGGIQPEINTFTRLIHHTREAIFFISPEQAGAVGATAPPELFAVVSAVVEDWQKPKNLLAQRSLDGMQLLLRGMELKLRERLFPVPDEINQGYDALASDLLSLVGSNDPQRRSRTAKLLARVAESMKDTMPMGAQLIGLENQLRAWRFPRTSDGKLDLRLALTVTKADLIMKRDPVLADAGDMNPMANVSSSPAQWRQAVRASSDKARAVLLHYDPQVVSLAEGAFREVGYFFASALGRDTELLAVQERSANRVDDSELDDSELDEVRTNKSELKFQVRKRLPFGTDGTRHPGPIGVLNPLLWILMG